MSAEVKRMKEEGRKRAAPSREAVAPARHSGASRGFIADGTRNPAFRISPSFVISAPAQQRSGIQLLLREASAI
jgi:hypothetical protein